MDLNSSNHHQTLQQKLHHLFIPPFFNKREGTYILLLFTSLFITTILFYNIITPFNPHHLLGIGFLSQILPTTYTSGSQNACDYSYGRWFREPNYPLSKYTEDCPFLDPGFRCHRNGRPDFDFVKLRWQPQGCNLPRFDASEFLERSRNGRIVFAGDSIGRNQWESLLCMLSKGVSNLSTIYEEYGNPITKHKGFLSIRFQDYNLTIEYYRVPFLVVVDHPPQNASKEVQGAIRVDKLHWFSSKWVGADVLIFSAGHWWNKDKTVKMGWYFQEKGTVNMTMDIMEAFGKSLQTLKSWVQENLDSEKCHIFFRSYSPVHYKQARNLSSLQKLKLMNLYYYNKRVSLYKLFCEHKLRERVTCRGGEWNTGGYCDNIKAPEISYTKLEREPLSNQFLSSVIKQMATAKFKVKLLNITYLTAMRKDGHPSRHREPGTPATAPQDCSHWCLPGVPDTWNELLYAQLLSNGFRVGSR